MRVPSHLTRIGLHFHKHRNLIGLRFACSIHWKQLSILTRESAVQKFGPMSCDAALEQCAFRTGIHNRRTGPAKFADRVLDDLNTFLVSLEEELLRHILANHPDRMPSSRRVVVKRVTFRRKIAELA